MTLKFSKRDDKLDKFYTDKKVVEECITHFKNVITVSDSALIIEPSAGDGAFIKDINEIGCHTHFYDIEPNHNEIIKQDYLSLNTSILREQYKEIHIIGNPPFGRQSTLALKFVKKSEFADSISFILPRSFKKESMKKRFPLNFHLFFETDLPEESFTYNGENCSVPCIFQIWVKKDEKRDVVIKEKPIKFIFVKKDENPHISFRRVGINAGFISEEINIKNEQSHYFIKFNDEYNRNLLIESLGNCRFEMNNTVGPKSISKQELIKEFNKILKR